MKRGTEGKDHLHTSLEATPKKNRLKRSVEEGFAGFTTRPPRDLAEVNLSATEARQANSKAKGRMAAFSPEGQAFE